MTFRYVLVCVLLVVFGCADPDPAPTLPSFNPGTTPSETTSNTVPNGTTSDTLPSAPASRLDETILIEAWNCEVETEQCVALADNNVFTSGRTYLKVTTTLLSPDLPSELQPLQASVRALQCRDRYSGPQILDM